MNILISDKWLREHLDTKATPAEISKYLSLSGPSVERTQKVKGDYIYDIEVTTNRVDAMSVRGIARELSAILPKFAIKATLKPAKKYSKKLPNKGAKLELLANPELVSRLMGVVIEDIKNWETPKWMRERLESAGHRSLNAVVDITNYVMHEVGHPAHVFDFDRIANQKIVVRESKKGEKITSFDGKVYSLPGGDIVFEDGSGEIIDLPGIIGLKNSVVTKTSKRALLFFDTNDPAHIRRTSMSLAIRTTAATLNEKGVDPELASTAMSRALLLFEEVCKARIASPIFDKYAKPYKKFDIKLSQDFITKKIGVEVEKSETARLLKSLEFGTKWQGNNLSVSVPSFRALDVRAPVDIVEEVARIYGFHNLPSELMDGALPAPVKNTFYQENKIKNILTRLGASEVYTYSLVSSDMTESGSLKLVNPLGKDSEYLRDNLYTSLMAVGEDNAKRESRFSIFEMANIYIAKRGDLPDEVLTLAGVFAGFEYFEAKGVIEAFLESMNIEFFIEASDSGNFKKGTGIAFRSGEYVLIEMGVSGESEIIYYEGNVKKLVELMRDYPKFTPIPKYPAQVEDITIEVNSDRLVGEVVNAIKSAHKHIARVELTDIFENKYTFRIWYQAMDKTLTDEEVTKIREKILKAVK